MTCAYVLSVDPGPEFSAWVQMAGNRLVLFAKEPTPVVRDRVRRAAAEGADIAIEMIASYGMAVGREIFQTCLEIGRMVEIAPHAWLITRGDVKMHTCRSMRATDSNIRVAMIDRFGPGPEKAIGKKASPGPLFGVAGDVWAALALGCYVADIHAGL